MSQFTFGNIDEEDTDGFDLAQMLESFEAAVNSSHSGSSEPSYKVAGITWRDTTATPWLVKVYDGAQWIITGEINATTHVFKPYYSGTVLSSIVTLTIGNGLESSGGTLRIKLKDGALERDADGITIAPKGIDVLLHLDDQVDGSMLTWDANGEAILVGPGTAGQVFTSNGAGQPGSFQTPTEPSTGLQRLANWNLAGTTGATLSFDPSLYDVIEMYFSNVSKTGSSASGFAALRLGIGGVINTTTGNYQGKWTSDSTVQALSYFRASPDSIPGTSSGTGERLWGKIDINNPNYTGDHLVTCQEVNGSAIDNRYFRGNFQVAGAINVLQFTSAGPAITFNTGTVTIWGRGG